MDKFKTLDSVISYWALHKPDSPAIVSERDNEQITYRELDNLINRFCTTFDTLIRPGHRCVLPLNDTIVCHAIVHAIFRKGGIFIPLDSQLGISLKKNIISHCSPEIIICTTEEEKDLPANFEATERIFPYDSALKSYDKLPAAEQHIPQADNNDLAMIAYTSGTTSDPKGVMLSHKNLLSAYGNAAAYLMRPSGIGCVFRIATLGTLGIHFFYAQYCGAATVLLPKLTVFNASSFWEWHKQHNIDFIYVVPSFVKLLNHLGKPSGEPIKGIIASAGAPLSAREQAIFQEKFNAALLNIYGLTESSFAVFYGSSSHGKGANDVGKPLSVLIKVIDENGKELPAGEEGELYYSGEMVSAGYYNNADATAQVFFGGWLRTGDLVKQLPGGEIQITGRKKDIIIRGGFNIHLREIEEVLTAQPEVNNAFILGVSNEVKGEELLAYIQIANEQHFSRSVFIEKIKSLLGDFRSPDKYFFTTKDIPLNAAGKADRAVILEEFNI